MQKSDFESENRTDPKELWTLLGRIPSWGFCQAVMTLESSSNIFAYASLICSGLFWLGAVLSLFPGVPGINFSSAQWLNILGAGAGLAVVAGVLNYEKKLWIFALVLALLTLFLAFYASVS